MPRLIWADSPRLLFQTSKTTSNPFQSETLCNPLPNQHNSFQNDRKTQLHPQALDTWLLWVVSNVCCTSRRRKHMLTISQYLKERRRCSYYPRHPYTTCEGLQGRIQGYRAGLSCVRLIEEGHREVQNRPSTRRRYLLWQCTFTNLRSFATTNNNL